MTPYRAAIVENALTAKGFEQKNGGHRTFRLVVDGQKTGVVTHTSHNSQQIDEFLLRSMAGQVRLPVEDFARLVECTLTGADYAARMVEDGQVVLRNVAKPKVAAKSKAKPTRVGKDGKRRR